MTYYMLKLIDQIYNGQVGDLLDPAHRNLKVIDLCILIAFINFFYHRLMPLWTTFHNSQIKDDAKHGFYIENLTEEYCSSFDDVTQILIKVCNRHTYLLVISV